MQKITLEDIEKTFKEKSWWAYLFNLKPAKYITYLIANKTDWTPNQITLWSLIFAILSGVSFYFDHFVWGAFLYQFSYILDIVDGSLARAKNATSEAGAFFDVFTDWIKAPILFIILFTKTDHQTLLLFLLFLLFLSCLTNRYNDMLYFKGVESITKSHERGRKSIMGQYIAFMRNRNIYLLPSTVEMEGLILFLYPLFKNDLFLYGGIFILLFNILLKLFVIIKKLS